MRFTPVTEEAAQQSARGYLLKPGECEFEVKRAEEQVSNQGNPMMKLTLDVWDADGKKATVFDYLLDAIPHKARHFAYSVGLGHVYESGDDMPAEVCEGKGGRLIIRNKQQAGYDPKNEVADYVVSEKAKTTTGYQRAKATDNGNTAPPATGRSLAWKWFCARTANMDSNSRNDAWRKAISDFFGHSDQSKISDSEWRNIGIVIQKSWTPENGIPASMRARQTVGAGPSSAPMSPLGDEQEFTEDDIPFAWEGRHQQQI